MAQVDAWSHVSNRQASSSIDLSLLQEGLNALWPAVTWVGTGTGVAHCWQRSDYGSEQLFVAVQSGEQGLTGYLNRAQDGGGVTFYCCHSVLQLAWIYKATTIIT